MSDQQDILARLDLLLMRVLDGEATTAEHRELLSLPDGEIQLAQLRGLSEILVDAVTKTAGDEPELAEPIMRALGLSDVLSETFTQLRELSSEPVDVADAVMAALMGDTAAEMLEVASPDSWISALHDGELPLPERLRIASELPGDRAALKELSAYAEMGRLVRTALQHEVRLAKLDPVWAAVARGIGLESPEHVPGWEPVGEALRQAVAERGQLTPGEQRELADHVMAALPQVQPDPAEINLAPKRPRSEPGDAVWWKGLLGPGLAMIAVALFLVSLVQPGDSNMPVQDPGSTVTQEEVFDLAAMNEAELEEVETADNFMLHVLQAEEGGLMILMLQEVTDQALDDEAWDEIEWEEI